MIELKNVSKIYNKGKDDEVQALNDVNLTFENSGLYFITGKSGSGKSTLLNVLGGLDSITEGQIAIDEESFAKFTNSQFDDYRKNKVGFIFQNFNLIDELTVGENIALALDLKGERCDEEKIKEALKSVDLEGYEKRKASKLSGGQKQRVAVARALVKSPEIILADEPTGNLDSKTSQTIFELLENISKERLVIVVSHDEESVKKYADTIIECVDGEVTLKENTKKDVEYISQKVNSKELQSKGMSVRSITKLGLGFASKHKFRLIVTLVLVVFALSFIGVAVTMAEVNSVTVEYGNLVASGEKIVHLGANLSPNSKLHGVGEICISNANAKKICDELSDFDFNIIYKDTRFYSANYNIDFRDNDRFHNRYMMGSAVLTQDDLTRFGMTMLAGRLPSEKFEVALPAYVCDTYLEYGLFNDELEELEPIESYSAIIGKIYDEYFQIVGVVDTGLDMSKYLSLKNVHESMTEEEYNDYGNLYTSLQDATLHSIHNSIIVSQFYIDYFYELPTVDGLSGSMVGQNSSFLKANAKAYSNLYTQEEGYLIAKFKNFTSLADDEVIFDKERLFYFYRRHFGVAPSDEELKDFCINNKISFQFREDEEPKEFNIVGVIDTRYNYSYLIPYFAPSLIMAESFLSQYNEKDDMIWALYTPLSGDKNKDKELVALSQRYDLDENFYFPIYWSAMDGLENGNMFATAIKYCGVATGVIFLIFTILMLINYMSATISSSQKQIGILKALGAGNKELIAIFSVEAVLIGLIGFVLAIVLAVGWIAICEYLMLWGNQIVMGMEVSWLSALALFGVAAITCVLGSIFPIKKLLKKKPIDIINI